MKKQISLFLLVCLWLLVAKDDNQKIINEIFKTEDFSGRQKLFNQLTGDSAYLQFVEKAFTEHFTGALSSSLNINNSTDYFVYESVMRIKSFEDSYNLVEKFAEKYNLENEDEDNNFNLRCYKIMIRLLHAKIHSSSDSALALSDSSLGIGRYMRLLTKDKIKKDQKNLLPLEQILQIENPVERRKELDDLISNDSYSIYYRPDGSSYPAKITATALRERQAAFINVPDSLENMSSAKLMGIVNNRFANFNLRVSALLALTDQESLKRITNSKIDINLKKLAVRKITDQDFLVQIIRSKDNANYKDFGWFIYDLVKNQDVLKELVKSKSYYLFGDSSDAGYAKYRILKQIKDENFIREAAEKNYCDYNFADLVVNYVFQEENVLWFIDNYFTRKNISRSDFIFSNPLLIYFNKINSQETINKYAKNNNKPFVKAAAIAFVMDQNLLREIVKQDTAQIVQMAAIENPFYTDFDYLAKIMESAQPALADKISKKFKIYGFDFSKLQFESNPEYRKKRIEQTTDQQLLKKYALTEPDVEMFRSCLAKINEQTALTELLVNFATKADSIYLMPDSLFKDPLNNKVDAGIRNRIYYLHEKIFDKVILNKLFKQFKSIEVQATFLRNKNCQIDEEATTDAILNHFKAKANYKYFYFHDPILPYINNIQDSALLNKVIKTFDNNQIIDYATNREFFYQLANENYNYFVYPFITKNSYKRKMIEQSIWLPKHLKSLAKTEKDPELKQAIIKKLADYDKKRKNILNKVAKGESVYSEIKYENFEDFVNYTNKCNILPYLEESDFVNIIATTKHKSDRIEALNYITDQNVLFKILLINTNTENHEIAKKILDKKLDDKLLKSIIAGDYPVEFKQGVLQKIEDQSYFKSLVEDKAIPEELKGVALAKITEQTYLINYFSQHYEDKESRMAYIAAEKITDLNILQSYYEKAPRYRQILENAIVKEASEASQIVLQNLFIKYQESDLIYYIKDQEFLKQNMSLFNDEIKKSIIEKCQEDLDYIKSLISDPLKEDMIVLTLDAIYSWHKLQPELKNLYDKSSNLQIKNKILLKFTDYSIIKEIMDKEKLQLTDEQKERISQNISKNVTRIQVVEELDLYLFQNYFAYLKIRAYRRYDELISNYTAYKYLTKEQKEEKLKSLRQKMIAEDITQKMVAYFIQSNLITDEKQLYEFYANSDFETKQVIAYRIKDQNLLQELLKIEQNQELRALILNNLNRK